MSSNAPNDVPTNNYIEEPAGSTNHPSSKYSRQIREALTTDGAPSNCLRLQEIYAWFEHHSPNADTTDQSYKNGVRRALAVDPSFQKRRVEDGSPEGYGFVWELARDAN